MRVRVEITGVIDIPDMWITPPGLEREEEKRRWTEDNVEFWFNEHLSEEDAIEDIARRLKKYPDEFFVRAMTEGVKSNETDNRQA